MGLKYVFGTAVLAVVCAACEKDSAGELMREECDRIVFDTPALMVETVTRSTLKDALVPGDEFGVLGIVCLIRWVRRLPIIMRERVCGL